MVQSKSQTILIVDPETDFLDWAKSQLETSGTRVLTTPDAENAVRLAVEENPDLIITEINISPFSGLELLKRVRQRDPNAMVILASAFSTTQSVIESMKLGAFDFIRKESLPFSFKIVVDSALKARKEIEAATAFKPQLTVEQHRDSIVGKSEPMQQVFKMIGRVAGTDAPVMITGESGAGKELIAKAIHRYSQRATADFVAINCAAIPENLLESELFGHEKGAFTGAHSQRVGRFEQSNGGTLFLDEIGDLPLAVQGKLLRVLQEGEFCRVGGNVNLKTDVRIVAATNKNLEQEVAAKSFREDLFYRLNVVRIHLPPLRQRVEDVRLLAEYFIQKISSQKNLPKPRLSEEAVKILEAYPWPGNVRELENTLQRACVLATGDVLLPKDLPLGSAPFTDTPEPAGLPIPAAPQATPVASSTPPQLPAPPVAAEPPTPPVVPVATVIDDPRQPEQPSAGAALTPEKAVEFLLNSALENPTVELLPWVEEIFTRLAMKRTGGNQIRTAKLLGISRATLRKRLERIGVLRPRQGPSPIDEDGEE